MSTRTLFGAIFVLFLTLLPTSSTLAQSSDGSTTVSVGLFVLVALIVLSAVMLISDNLLSIESKKSGLIQKENESGGLGISGLLAPKAPGYVDGTFTKVKEGYDIQLKGAPESTISDTAVSTVAIQPPNFVGMSPIPKLLVAEGDEVKAGDPLFFDKKRPEINYVSPVSGEIAAITRGEKRSITEIVILVDGEQKYREMPSISSEASRDELVAWLLETGGWTLLKQRPYDIVPDPKVVPSNVFVSTFDSAPLGPDLALIASAESEAFHTGIEFLPRLTSGDVHLGLDARSDVQPAAIFTEAKGSKHYFSGAHPIGNVGVQMHHVNPVSNQNIAWVLGVQEVIALGKLVSEGRYDGSRIVAVTGGEILNPHYVRTYQGAKISDLTKDNVTTGQELRYISGDVLSGHHKEADSYLDFADDQITVIAEGKEYELFGWLLPLKARPSVSRTFPNFLFPDNKLSVTTNTHGEERAFVMTGQYEAMLPMDIYPQHLMKAILANDFERMEGLGIYELSEEDVALCEFACTSKQPLQHILREGLNFMREQG